MVPPRLSLVANDDDDDPRAPASEDGAASPVHELIAQIEARPAADAAAPDAGDPAPAGADPAALSAVPSSVSPAESDRRALRILEAVLFASAEPVDEDRLARHLPPGADIKGLIAELQASCAGRGVELVRVAGKWMFRTAEDLSFVLERHAEEERRLSRAALETLSIIAYHQPVTRAEIEEIRGVTTSKGTLDVLMEAGFVRPRGRRRAPGKPVTYGTTENFLVHFGLDGIKDLPGLAELKGSGLLDANLPPDFKVPEPTDIAALMPDELPLDAGGDDDEAQAELDLDEPELPEAEDEDQSP